MSMRYGTIPIVRETGGLKDTVDAYNEFENTGGNQKALLQALAPYLSSGRIHKLEKAMRAAKLAGMASSFLGR